MPQVCCDNDNNNNLRNGEYHCLDSDWKINLQYIYIYKFQKDVIKWYHTHSMTSATVEIGKNKKSMILTNEEHSYDCLKLFHF